MILNDQVLDGPVAAEQRLVVQEAVGGLAAGTAAGGNTLIVATQRQDLRVESSQQLNAGVTADAYVQSRYTAGPAFVAQAQANGNAGEASTCCGKLTADVTQTIAPHTEVKAYQFSAAGGPVEHVSTSAAAVGNSQGYAAVGGDIGARTVQRHEGATTSYNGNVFCCISGSGTFTSTAVSNNVDSAGNYGSAYHEVDQRMTGYSTWAGNEVYAVNGNNVTGVATATANNLNMYNTAGAAELTARQTNTGQVKAISRVTLDNWYGTGASVAYGVGNAIALANQGGEPYMDTAQSNRGEVISTAFFTGGTGEGSVTSAQAVGNTVSGVACGDCYGGITASNRQVNDGAVRATATTTIGGHAHGVTSVSTAMGNSASYEVRSSGN